ncbi:MAG TPA: ABC transporter ATP-binding protein [Candidatus Aminicenantes bacterium]|nr:ABC transporter ATP-binding protein [Candidatus Aminicenantes bacterium]HOS11731.1 ABC transporter ATP-binding protein [Candidatus Aminicenantes bacterium]HPL13717.1 ABC transporter ATP-binding protein [Candidatus Aminicenantes bacterium]HQF98559.1 ABC transporter ATP-binding protein [Candidatus Aminicenantes bacterium]HQH45826.1 ABC transporter ATP-binding protein [Candidatus Aminicenantes bacterium]
MLETQNLTKIYEDGRTAVDHLNLKVEPGEIFCMFGANGAGKTTTINLFLNFIPPTEGTALIEGIDVVREPLRSKEFVSFVSENVTLYGNFTAIQNLDYFTKLSGKRGLGKADYARALESVGLQKDVFDARSKTYSKGMRQKLGLAIAIIKDAPNIILDEPTSGLDPKSGQEFLNLLAGMRDKGKSVFMSTHDIFRAKMIADRVGFMKNGKMGLLMTRDELKGQDLTELYVQFMDERD